MAPATTGGNYNRSRCDPTPRYLSKLATGGGQLGRGGGVSGRVGGGGGGIGSSAGGVPRGGGLRTTHYYHTHTSRVCVCASGHGGIEVCMR